jgi:anti-sigma factor ChrR (cupin superfamily)
MERAAGTVAAVAARIVVDGNALTWMPSPVPGVWRKRLFHVGAAESGRVTSLVRFEPGSRFPMHPHPKGEEIYVLSGTFSDDDGNYPAGTYLLNPDGSSHAPWSAGGCTLFVRLRQHPGPAVRRSVVDAESIAWHVRRGGGSAEKPLVRRQDGQGRTSLIRIDPAGRVARHGHPFGEEAFVLEGELVDEHGRYPAGTWIRNPVGSAHAPRSDGGCFFLLSTGLPDADHDRPA